jgi:hypothetical protein
MVFKIVDFPDVFDGFTDIRDMPSGFSTIASPIDILVRHK